MKNRYQDLYETSRDFIKAYKGFKQFIKKPEKKFVDHITGIIKKNLLVKNENKLVMLDIGGGDGKVSVPILRTLSKDRHINYHYIDVSGLQLNAFRTSASRLNNVSFHLKRKSWQAYKTKVKFDLIIALNSWYGIALEYIPKLKILLKPNGIAILSIGSKESISQDIPLFIGEEKILSSEDILDYLRQNKIAFRRYILKSNTTVLDFLEGDNIRKEAKSFFRYLLRGKYIPRTAIIDRLKSKRRNKIYFSFPQHTFILKLQN